MKVFVYGTLKKGFGNHGFLNNSEFISKVKTVSKSYDLVNLGNFPALIKGGSYDVYGELYSIDSTTLRNLDYLEGNTVLYTRDKISVCSYEDSRLVWSGVWAYMMDSPPNYSNTINSYNNIKAWVLYAK